jgi:hypothetical protein
MQPRTRMLSALTLSIGMALGAAAMAADMPKEGTYNADYTSYGTSKATAIGRPLPFAIDVVVENA